VNKRILLVTGSEGLAGSAIFRQGPRLFDVCCYATRKDADLTKEDDVSRLFAEVRPTHVIHTAAAVGGIGGNAKNHGRFFRDNILMNTHVIHEAMKNKVEKLVAFSSVCVYPDGLPALQEDKMHDGPVYPSNEFYGYAKRMVDVQIRAYEKQYGTKNFMSVTPGNIFGPNDHFNIEVGHVVPVLMHKLYLAKNHGSEFEVWGDGSSLREFLYIDDLARVCLDLLDMDELPQRLIVAGEKEMPIRDMVRIMCHVADYPYEKVVWNTSKPNGQRSRPSDKSLFNQYFPNFQYTPIEEGIKTMWNWFNTNYEVARK
jgi:GDP-L-fucose synthase